jgi:hypothetical protein
VPTLQLKGDRFPYPDMLMEAVTEKLAQSDRPNGTDKAITCLSRLVTMQIRKSLGVNLRKSVERFFCVPCSFSLDG